MKVSTASRDVAAVRDDGAADASPRTRVPGIGCKGDIPIKADATLTHTHTSMKIKANGSATVLGIIPASVSAKAEATYMGDCTPDEVAKEIARWNEENP
jgi:hypothetical protein